MVLDGTARGVRMQARAFPNPRALFAPQEFIRLGSLSKLSGKGLQQRMFFLVSAESRRPSG